MENLFNVLIGVLCVVVLLPAAVLVILMCIQGIKELWEEIHE